MRKTNIDKRKLYESIMKNVSKSLKKQLNESSGDSSLIEDLSYNIHNQIFDNIDDPEIANQIIDDLVSLIDEFGKITFNMYNEGDIESGWDEYSYQLNICKKMLQGN